MDDLVELAKSLSAEERRRLLDEIERSLTEEEARAAPPAAGPYSRSLKLAGSVHSDFADLSSDKYTHVAASVESTGER